MRKIGNKRGFTLTEIILVIAIIVILTGALAAGIAIDLNRYKAHLSKLESEGGTAWEGDARSHVKGMFGSVDAAPEYTGTPTLPTDDETEATEDTEDTEETEPSDESTESSEVTQPTNPPTIPTEPTHQGGGGGAPVASNNQKGKTGNFDFSVSASSDWTVTKNGSDITFTRNDGSGDHLTFTAQAWGNLVYELDSNKSTSSLERSIGIDWNSPSGTSTNRQVGNGNWDGTSFWENQGIYLYH